MKNKYIYIAIAFLIFVVFPFYEAFITGMTPGSGCCNYYLILKMDYNQFKEKYKDMFKGKVHAERGNVILIYGSYFRVTHGKLQEDSTKTFVTFRDYCSWTSDIHNNRNFTQLSRIYYWKRKYLIWKIKSFFSEDMARFEHETLYE